MLGLDANRPEDAQLRAVHPSVGALLAWRFAQLLTALPQRGTEAARWERLARALYDERPIGRMLEPERWVGGWELGLKSHWAREEERWQAWEQHQQQPVDWVG